MVRLEAGILTSKSQLNTLSINVQLQMPSCRIHTFFGHIMAFVLDVQPRVSPWASSNWLALNFLRNGGKTNDPRAASSSILKSKIHLTEPHQWYLCPSGWCHQVLHFRLAKIDFGWFGQFSSKGWAAKIPYGPWGYSKTSTYSAQRSCTSRHAHSGRTPGHHNPWRKPSHHNYLSITAVSSDSYSKYDMKVNPSQPPLLSNQ